MFTRCFLSNIVSNTVYHKMWSEAGLYFSMISSRTNHHHQWCIRRRICLLPLRVWFYDAEFVSGCSQWVLGRILPSKGGFLSIFLMVWRLPVSESTTALHSESCWKLDLSNCRNITGKSGNSRQHESSSLGCTKSMFLLLLRSRSTSE